MPKAPKAAPRASWNPEVQTLVLLATTVSVVSFLFYFQRGEVLLYGDAIAHMNIARRVFDSKTPGLLQLGTVWLPLPHLLMIPFLVSEEMWRRGVGGSIPSMAAYVFSVAGIFRLVRGMLARGAEPDTAVRVAAWAAAGVYAANPNLIYLQTTAMGESLYLAFFIWSVVYFSDATRGDATALAKSALCVLGASLTRYDGWFLVAVLGGTVTLLTILKGRFSKAAMMRFVLVLAAGPILWLAYNGIVYRNPLEFANGPYSAKAIERKTQSAGNPGHPGSGNLGIAGLYFLKSAEFNVAENPWLQRMWILLLAAGMASALLPALHGAKRIPEMAGTPDRLTAWPLLLLLIPIPFYAISIAYSGVPIFIPAWWPFTHYNTRYGLQLLPAFSVALAVLAYGGMRLFKRWKLGGVLALTVVVVASYASLWRATPISLKEAQVNMRTRNRLETQLAVWLEKLPPQSTLLMYLGDHVGALQQADVPLKRVINEGNHRVWKQPSDPEGLWEKALSDPAGYADYVVAFEGDPVWQAVADKHLRELIEIHVTGQARGVLYRAR